MIRSTDEAFQDLRLHPSRVTAEDRQRLFSQKPLTLWFTGLSGAGKSTLAFSVEKSLIDSGKPAFVLDGDNVRHGLCKDLGFLPEDRSENIRRIAEVARLMNEAGICVLVACISPCCSQREQAKEIIGDENFVEVYLSTPLSVCERLDPKGLYRKARAGLIQEFTGVSAVYEVPEVPSLILDASQKSISECLLEITKKIDDWQTKSPHEPAQASL
ncbi:adenylyl-sulfate kinase [Pseudomonas fluorescens]|uniref:adenylyl-sulfate kinase n=1 Tax=Pseudomonas fluorescens TaxID=294 RepID=UPI002866F7B3|nr:adenylyl-sulfate kinase [Pseudomonas fluorescens]MDR6163042.1 adenylylsulfate kinase [Pseudomonas fluorescens]